MICRPASEMHACGRRAPRASEAPIFPGGTEVCRTLRQTLLPISVRCFMESWPENRGNLPLEADTLRMFDSHLRPPH
jgi:hypothetical protein